MKSLVVLPTYNEKDNIREVVEKILNQNDNIGVVIVDDNSPDGTGETADQLVTSKPGRVWVIHRRGKRGRGLAGIEGFKYALTLGADYIFEMDADLSHRPEEIPLFLEKIKDYEVVIGSRYINKGALLERNLGRKIISFLARHYLRLVLGFKVTDPGSGFRCFRRSALAAVGLTSLSSKGPSVVTEILHRCCMRNFSMVEVPIIFEERKSGKSKLNGPILITCLLFPLRIRLSQKNLKKI